MYVLDWGGGYGRDNPTSGLYRIDYISGSRSPVARIDAEPDSGQAPLEVTFDASASTDPEDEDLTYAWDFDGDGTTDATGVTATHTYTENGVFNARLTVTDPADKSGTTTVPITVGNTRPVVELETPPNGAFFDFGDEISWDVKVTDPEEETVDPQAVEVQPALGHDDHAHPLVASRGFTGSTVTSDRRPRGGREHLLRHRRPLQRHRWRRRREPAPGLRHRGDLPEAAPGRVVRRQVGHRDPGTGP